jgi:hypothetical protein
MGKMLSPVPGIESLRFEPWSRKATKGIKIVQVGNHVYGTSHGGVIKTNAPISRKVCYCFARGPVTEEAIQAARNLGAITKFEYDSHMKAIAKINDKEEATFDRKQLEELLDKHGESVVTQWIHDFYTKESSDEQSSPEA